MPSSWVPCSALLPRLLQDVHSIPHAVLPEVRGPLFRPAPERHAREPGDADHRRVPRLLGGSHERRFPRRSCMRTHRNGATVQPVQARAPGLAGPHNLRLLARCARCSYGVQVAGTFKGEPVKGLGFVERNNFARLNNMDAFLKSVGSEVHCAAGCWFQGPPFPCEPGTCAVAAACGCRLWHVSCRALCDLLCAVLH